MAPLEEILAEAYGEPTIPDAADTQWADVVPVEADDNPSALASIMYPPDYAQGMSLRPPPQRVFPPH
jgi:protein farnesyltransferase/geranylgeranyltransferase type-1 subunit alpha